jgi:hypothetical protein
MTDLLDEICSDESTVDGHCEDCDWRETGQGLAGIREVMMNGDRHATELAHSVKLDLEA